MKKIIVFLMLCMIPVLSSCGGTTVKVRQSSDGVSATVSVETNNPTNVDVKPSVTVSMEDLSCLLNSVQDSLEFDEKGEMEITSKDIVRFIRSYNYAYNGKASTVPEGTY